MFLSNDEPIRCGSDLASYIAVRVGEVRRMRGLSRAVVARRAGMHPRYLAKLEDREVDLYPHMLRRLSQAMRISLEELLSVSPLSFNPRSMN